MMFTLLFSILLAPAAAQVTLLSNSPPPPPAPSPPDASEASGDKWILSELGGDCDTACKDIGMKCDEPTNIGFWAGYEDDEAKFTEHMESACANTDAEGLVSYDFKCNGCKTFKSSKFKTKGLPGIFPKKSGNQPQCEVSKSEDFTCYKGNNKRHLMCFCSVSDLDGGDNNQEIGAAPSISSFTLFTSVAAIVAAFNMAF